MIYYAVQVLSTVITEQTDIVTISILYTTTHASTPTLSSDLLPPPYPHHVNPPIGVKYECEGQQSDLYYGFF